MAYFLLPSHCSWSLLLLFFPTFSNDFVNWDDGENIYDNADLVAFDWNSMPKIFTSNIMGGYNPLPIFTFAIERAFFGLNPVVFHTNNLLLHLICVFLVFRIGLLMKLNQWHAAILALLFGIHPMRVESVAWATERKDVLFGAFLFWCHFVLSNTCSATGVIPAISSWQSFWARFRCSPKYRQWPYRYLSWPWIIILKGR